MLERALAIRTKQEGDSRDVAGGNFNLSLFDHRVANRLPHGDARNVQLTVAITYIKETIRISTNINNSDHPDTLRYEQYLSELQNLYTS